MRSTTVVPLLALVGSGSSFSSSPFLPILPSSCLLPTVALADSDYSTAFAFSNPYASLHLLKRQSASDLSSATAAAETLATDAVTAISNGTCSTECTGMITSLTVRSHFPSLC